MTFVFHHKFGNPALNLPIEFFKNNPDSFFTHLADKMIVFDFLQIGLIRVSIAAAWRTNGGRDLSGEAFQPYTTKLVSMIMV